MHYRVDELARAAGVPVDTLRFYQSRGLLPPPARRGRIALYSQEHLERVRRIRRLNREGLKLEAVGRLLESEAERDASSPRAGRGVRSSLLRAIEESAPRNAPSFTREELQAEAGLPGFAIDALEQLGLLSADGESSATRRYSQSDRDALHAARSLLDAGLPFGEMLELAREHAAQIERTAERAVALFEASLSAEPDAAGDEAAATFQRLLPAATRLVALHFEQTLLGKARKRLEARSDGRASASAAAGESAEPRR